MKEVMQIFIKKYLFIFKALAEFIFKYIVCLLLIWCRNLRSFAEEYDLWNVHIWQTPANKVNW